MKIRNGQYQLKEMLPGDRFYFANGKRKVLYSLDSQNPFESFYQKGFWKEYANCVRDGSAPTEKPERHLQITRVIFLRNINQTT